MDFENDDLYFDLEDILGKEIPEIEREKRIYSLFEKVDHLKYAIENYGPEYVDALYTKHPLAHIRFPSCLRTIAILYLDSEFDEKEAIEHTDELRSSYEGLIKDYDFN